MKITLIGVPFNRDGTDPEIENPVQSFRDEGLISLLKEKGHQVSDIGDLEIPSCTNKKIQVQKSSILMFGEMYP